MQVATYYRVKDVHGHSFRDIGCGCISRWITLVSTHVH